MISPPLISPEDLPSTIYKHFRPGPEVGFNELVVDPDDGIGLTLAPYLHYKENAYKVERFAILLK